MNRDHLSATLALLRTAEAFGNIPAKAMFHIQAAIERLERKMEKMVLEAPGQ
jgi:hypothetical protein